jgi:hypothetical protein
MTAIETSIETRCIRVCALHPALRLGLVSAAA